MTTLPNLNASVVSAQNQSIASLVNFNIDISLFRCDPSPEFLPIGNALTQRRKVEAENGPFHKLACRLGFLFDEIVPDTPRLRDAYGTRVSSIIQHPDINPRGTTEDGPFQEFVGADGTSIWAAATSVPASINLYLLACMLARAWDAREATAIWCEVVHERKRHIQAEVDKKKLVNPLTCLAAQQDISRADLAKWDASARSWLRRADQSMIRERTQFKIIADNLVLPFGSSGNTFERVTGAWILSMEVIEKLMNNTPQMACDRAILLAISSWHLYPNLLVLKANTKNVPFNDHLFPGAAVLTLGLEVRDQTKFPEQLRTAGQWSLALSHLKYYGKPVQACGEESQRISIDQVWLFALGSILRQWTVSLRDLGLAVQWFKELGQVLLSQPEAQVAQLSWLFKLCDSAKMISEEECGNSVGGNMAFVTFAWRRATRFLGSTDALSPPFFGLCNSDVMEALKQRVHAEAGFDYMRRLAYRLDLPPEDAIILCSYTKHDGLVEGIYYEWATISPVQSTNAACEATQEQPEITEWETSARWIYCLDKEHHTNFHTQLEQRKMEINALGEQCDILQTSSTIPVWVDVIACGSVGFYKWENPPHPFSARPISAKFVILHKDRLDFDSIGFRLCVRKESIEAKFADYKADISYAANIIDLSEGIMWLKEKVNTQRAVSHISSFFSLGLFDQSHISRAARKRKRASSPDSEAEPKNDSFFYQGDTIHESIRKHILTWTTDYCRHIPYNWMAGLRGLEIVTVLYEQLPHATISSKIIDFKLSKAKWLDSIINMLHYNNGWHMLINTSVEEFCQKMTRANSISCLAMFESGQFDIDIEHTTNVIALCYEDSIYVAGVLLSDPTTKGLGVKVRHLVGNIGHPGMVLMIAPTEPQIRSPGYDARLVQHHLYDGIRMDAFEGTSMHLSFTNWEMPLDWDSTGHFDQKIFLIESVVSVQHNGKWIADLDVLSLERSQIEIMDFDCDCDLEERLSGRDIASLDSWEDLLDPPPSTAIVRARGNWVARLATVAILVQKKLSHTTAVAADEPVCWNCLVEFYADSDHLPQFIVD